MSPTRVLACAIVIALAFVAWLQLAHRAPEMPTQPEPLRSPPMDISSPNARRALEYLAQSGAGHFDGGWLGARCGAEDLGERYIWSNSDFSQRLAERASFHLDGDEGYFYFDAQPYPGVTGFRHGQRWTLVQGDVAQFRDILRQGEYFSRGSSDLGAGVCDAEVVTLESCIGGRYYGVVRECESLSDEDGKPRSSLNPMLRAFIADRTGRPIQPPERRLPEPLTPR